MIPPFADVICDCRALPGQDEADVRAHVDRALGDGFRYEVEFLEPLAGGTESAIDTPLYRVCEEYVAERLPGAELLPLRRCRVQQLLLGAQGVRLGRLRLRAGVRHRPRRLPRRRPRRRRGARGRRPGRDDASSTATRSTRCRVGPPPAVVEARARMPARHGCASGEASSGAGRGDDRARVRDRGLERGTAATRFERHRRLRRAADARPSSTRSGSSRSGRRRPRTCS